MGEFVGTPGPWRHCDASDGSEYVPAIDRRMANARLIESAPDLLAALAEVLGCWQQEANEGDGIAEHNLPAAHRAVAAIRKATA